MSLFPSGWISRRDGERVWQLVHLFNIKPSKDGRDLKIQVWQINPSQSCGKMKILWLVNISCHFIDGAVSLFRCCDCLHTIQKDFYLLVDIICAVVKWRFDYWILKLVWLISNDYWDFLCKSKLLQYCCEQSKHATLKALLLARF